LIGHLHGGQANEPRLDRSGNRLFSGDEHPTNGFELMEAVSNGKLKVDQVRDQSRLSQPYARAAKVSHGGSCPLRCVERCAASSGARTRCLFLFGTHCLPPTGAFPMCRVNDPRQTRGVTGADDNQVNAAVLPGTNLISEIVRGSPCEPPEKFFQNVMFINANSPPK